MFFSELCSPASSTIRKFSSAQEKHQALEHDAHSWHLAINVKRPLSELFVKVRWTMLWLFSHLWPHSLRASSQIWSHVYSNAKPTRFEWNTSRLKWKGSKNWWKRLNLNETPNHLTVAIKFECKRKLCLWKLYLGEKFEYRNWVKVRQSVKFDFQPIFEPLRSL